MTSLQPPLLRQPDEMAAAAWEQGFLYLKSVASSARCALGQRRHGQEQGLLGDRSTFRMPVQASCSLASGSGGSLRGGRSYVHGRSRLSTCSRACPGAACGPACSSGLLHPCAGL